MSLSKLATLRNALIAGVNAVFDVLEAAERHQPKRTVLRPVAQADGEYSELDEKRAAQIISKHGVRKS